MSIRILIAETKDFSAAALDVLRSIGTVDLQDTGPAGLTAALENYDVLWFRLGFRIQANDLPERLRCRFIVCPATGTDHIDEQACLERGIQILSLRGEADFLRTVRATAEHCIGLTLALLRHIPKAVAHVQTGGWNRNLFKGRELMGKTVGIAGMGRLGSIVAQYFQAFGCTVIAYDPRPFECPGVRRCMHLEELVSLADIVSIHINYLPENRHIFDKKLFSHFKKDSILINTSRGALIEEEALLECLQNGRLAGAALDVLENEFEPRRSALVAFARENDQLIITPHVGGNTVESFAKTELFMAQKLAAALHAGSAVKVLAIVPARAGSKRVPRKNIRPFAGSSLTRIALEQAIRSRLITQVALSSDSEEILALAAGFPGVRTLKRPDALAADDSPAIDYVRHALTELEQPDLRFDAVVILQPSSPLRNPDDIDATIRLLLEHPEADSAVSVVKLDHMVHPYKLKTLDGVELKPFLEEEKGRFAAQDLPTVYVRNCAVYATWREGLESRPDVIGSKSLAYVMPAERSIDINEPMDFEFGEYLFLKGK